MPLKNYTFEIRTLRDLSDLNSPHTLAKFEFKAKDENSAKKYMESLIAHHSDNAPYIQIMPIENSKLTTKE